MKIAGGACRPSLIVLSSDGASAAADAATGGAMGPNRAENLLQHPYLLAVSTLVVLLAATLTKVLAGQTSPTSRSGQSGSPAGTR